MEALSQQTDIFRPDELSPSDYAEFVRACQFAHQNRELLDSLTPNVRSAVEALGSGYLEAGQYTQLKKLFKNAVVYVAEGRVGHAPDGGFFVEGNTNDHHVTVGHDWGCDCDLFNGRAQFEGRAGECSHIQTVTLFMLAEQSG